MTDHWRPVHTVDSVLACVPCSRLMVEVARFVLRVLLCLIGLLGDGDSLSLPYIEVTRRLRAVTPPLYV